MTARHNQPGATITLAPDEVGYFLAALGYADARDTSACAHGGASEQMLLPGATAALDRRVVMSGCARTDYEVSPFSKNEPRYLHR